MSDIEGLMQALTGGKGKPKPSSSILPEAMLARIKEAYGWYERAKRMNPFNEGDIVMPREGVNVRGAGKPHIVVEVFDRKLQTNDVEGGSSGALRFIDMRVMTMEGSEDVVCYPTESWQYEEYKEE